MYIHFRKTCKIPLALEDACRVLRPVCPRGVPLKRDARVQVRVNGTEQALAGV